MGYDNPCADDAQAEGRCLCGNCSNPAVLGTCLRYSQGSDGWYLSGCKPEMDCKDVFNKSDKRDTDKIVHCPCANNKHPSGKPAPYPCPPTPRADNPSSPSVPQCKTPPPKKSFFASFFYWIGVAAMSILLIFLLRKYLAYRASHSDMYGFTAPPTMPDPIQPPAADMNSFM